jgi:hypothetical protein
MPKATAIAADGKTVRQRIIEALLLILNNTYDGPAPPADPPGEKVFRVVYPGNPEKLGNDQCPLACLEEGEEEMLESYGGCQTYNLPVFIHFRFTPTRGLDELQVYKYYLGIVQKAILADHQLGGLTLDIKDEGNDHQIIGIHDVYPGGTLRVLVKYRTRLHNPYKLMTET